MAGNDNNKGLLGVFQGAVDSVKSAAQGIKIPEIKFPEINIPNPFQKKPDEPEEANPSGEVKSISVKSAIKIIYYMMAVDGQVYQNEEERFDEIGRELDHDFDRNKDQIIIECQAQLNKLIDPEDQYAVLQDGVEDAISLGIITRGAVITPKVLVWDLLAIAYSDGKYDEKERQLLKYIVRKLNVDKALFLEMESSYLTLLDIEKELNWIKTTNRPYLTIEAMVNELSDRKNVILESLKDLIAF